MRRYDEKAVERWAADEFRSTNASCNGSSWKLCAESGLPEKSRVGKPEPKPEKEESMRIVLYGGPGSDDREPWKRKEASRNKRCAESARFRAFIHNRLWIGLPPRFRGGFGIVLLRSLSSAVNRLGAEFGAGIDCRRFMRIRLDIGRLGQWVPAG